ncbi:hypothetical protein ACFE04_018447 [Oxalis oulophora]
MWRLLAAMRRNLQNLMKSPKVADENMFGHEIDTRGGRLNSNSTGLSIIYGVVLAPFSCFSQPNVINGAADAFWVSADQFGQVSEMNHLMVNDSMRYAILM